ncbi:hypothetical protein EDD85DRAFT_956818 [Armillaria nabsnona]|nr:hypothetical protein EDD85DRAFT_956818 [Armillaria nabsnona]
MSHQLYWPRAFLEDAIHEKYICSVGCGTGWMSLSQALWHEDTDSHIAWIHAVTHSADSSNTTEQPSSPIQALSSPFKIPAQQSSPPQHSSSPISLPTIPVAADPTSDDPYYELPSALFAEAGPRLPTDRDDMIYNDFAGLWALYFPLRISDDDDADLSEDLDGSGGLKSSLDLEQAATNEEHPDLTDGYEALLDIMFSFPHSVFLENELNIMRWFSEKYQLPALPTVCQIKAHQKDVLSEAGMSMTTIKGAMGNLFSILDFTSIVAHEWANPLVCLHVSVLSEDSGERLSAPCQADKWRNEVSGTLAGPMVHHNGKDYLVHEPALVHIQGRSSYQAILPSQWFT